jgi:hypothetical protein
MDFYEVLDQIIALLRQRGRVSYHALKRQFDVDDAYLEDLKVELIEVQELARDHDGKMLVGHPFCFDMFGPLCDTSLHTESRGRSEPWARKPSTSSD